MKKFILLFLLVPVFAMGQSTNTSDLKQSAETFVAKYLKSWEDQKWDEVLNSISEEAVVISPDHLIKPYLQSRTSAIDNFKKNKYSDKIAIGSVVADVMSQNSAMVTAMFMTTGDRAGNLRITDNMNVFLLENKDGSWKIKKVVTQETYPVIYSDNVDKKFQTGIVGPASRFGSAITQMSAIIMYFLNESKKNGTTPAQVGKAMGVWFATTWDKSKGFQGLVSGFVWNVQTFSTYIEILERNDNTLKIKYDNSFFKPNPKNWDLTSQEILECWRNSFGEIAEWMGANCTLVEDGKYYVVTLTKK